MSRPGKRPKIADMETTIPPDTVYAEANLNGWPTTEGTPPADLPIVMRTQDPDEARIFLRSHCAKEHVLIQDGADYIFCRKVAPMDRASGRGEP